MAIIGTWMMAEKKLENWIIWILVDFVSIWMYLHKGLYFTMILYGLYTIMAIIGFIQWKRNFNIDYQTL
jgi:nicotinamide mononucleotide transporter